jgi:serine/threonine-protein kinase
MGHGIEGVPELGEVLLDKYRVDGLLGAGGMGAVLAATHLGLKQPVAIKFLLAGRATKDVQRLRFEREARAAAAIRSEHVCRVSDIGRLDDGTPYMVMEYLQGEDLAARIKRGPLDLRQAADFLLQACEALAEAHQAGIVHRDLKPANLFVAKRADGSDFIKVLDFGISKLTVSIDDSAESLTKTSALMGSPLYMAPEQMTSAKHVDHRVDIWALGCIFFQMLTQRAPFPGETLPEVCAMVLQKPTPNFSDFQLQLPAGVQGIFSRCLEKRREARYDDVSGLAEALVPFGGPEAARSAARARRVVASATMMSDASQAPGHEDTMAASRSRDRQQPPASPPISTEAQPPVLRGETTAGAVAQTLAPAGVRPSPGKAMLALGLLLAAMFGVVRWLWPTTTSASSHPAAPSAAQPSAAQPSAAQPSAAQPSAHSAVEPAAVGTDAVASPSADPPKRRRPRVPSAPRPTPPGVPATKPMMLPSTMPPLPAPVAAPPVRRTQPPRPTTTSGDDLFDKRDAGDALFDDRSP